MDSRKIMRVEKALGLNMFVFQDGSVMNASEIAVSLFEEVQALRWYGNKECTSMADESLNRERFGV